ncbi:MAG TPA: TlyA family RNA methyltransferase, partial [Pseudonocardiaceae bacterium]|nr:TlyA family RNA methyltransferase [Pseudonocardiaceae bacterium]
LRGTVANKPATAVDADAPVLVRADADDPGYASRGAHKLLGALTEFKDLTVAGRRCLDAGASTGGFTDVLLRNGAAQVVAADVGRGLLDWRLRTDDRVLVHDRTNVRTLTPQDIGGPVDLVVADLSFISLTLVLPALLACGTDDVDLLPMVKPQFEVGKDRLGSGGVVRTPELRADAVTGVITAAGSMGLAPKGVVASPLPGPAGNVEYFVWFRRGDPPPPHEVAELVLSAVRRGPQ